MNIYNLHNKLVKRAGMTSYTENIASSNKPDYLPKPEDHPLYKLFKEYFKTKNGIQSDVTKGLFGAKKQASMQKVAGPAAIKLRRIIAELNDVRSDKRLVDSLQYGFGGWGGGLLGDTLKPFAGKNKHLNILHINRLKSPFTYADADLNKLIDKINDTIFSRRQKIKALGGEDAARAYEQSIIDKYIKDIPSK